MTAVTRDLLIEQGASFKMGFNWKHESIVTPGTPGDPYDITDCVVRMQVRKKQQDPVLIDASTTNGKITIDGPEGRIDVKLPPADTNLLTSLTAKYDLEIEFTTGVLTGDVYRLIEGAITVKPNITQLPAEPVVGP